MRVHQREALGVGDDLAGVEGLLDVVDRAPSGRPMTPCAWAFEHLRGGDALVLLGREAAGEDRLGDQGQRHAQVAGRDDRPLAGPLLAGGVEDQVDHRLAGLGIVEAEDVAGDLDQVAVERPVVPAGEDVVHARPAPCRAARACRW